ncbi:hypothetical protein J2Z23_004152 [Lederbergia galactosidilyticus]|uniref:hypothetical protein n=1 Tax=Lederbergia galactosidilytica TaxID=217031 RepID=UPI001AE61C2D|nr:hypothetical protein [Lederbergia galactosidilytica]MBP1917167.1 hypothetical protein [Lederbergia galactosidilytica]
MLTIDYDEAIIENAIYLPMLIIILNRDLKVIESSQFKIKQPYLNHVESVIRTIQRDLSKAKKYMHDNKIKVEKMGTEGTFTDYLIIQRGYEGKRRYFNPVLKTRSEELLNEYLLNRKSDPPV